MDWSYDEKSVILYALSVGCRRQQTEYVYENDDRFTALATFPVLALHNGALAGIDMQEYVYDFNPMLLLHGEQYLELQGPVPTSATVAIKSSVVDIQRKGKATVVVMGISVSDAKAQQPIAYAEATIFLRGARPKEQANIQQAGRPADASAQYSVPDREPDAVQEERVSPDLAALYRLNGDSNPLHIDPEFAGLAGFQDPILHGLCTYGIGVRHVVQQFCNGEPSRVRSMKARFVKHVFPGDTLQTQMWRDGEDTIVFQMKVLERDAVVLSNAAVKLTADSLQNAKL